MSDDKIREAFERWCPIPDGVIWSAFGEYMAGDCISDVYLNNAVWYDQQWDAFQAGAESVATADYLTGYNEGCSSSDAVLLQEIQQLKTDKAEIVKAGQRYYNAVDKLPSLTAITGALKKSGKHGKK